MSLLEIVVLAFGLAMDATAVAGTRGLAAARVRGRDAILVAVFFGGFQGVMPWIGWVVGEAVAHHIAGWSHWLVFAVLSAIGGKMVHEAWQPRPPVEQVRDTAASPFGAKVLTALAVATSIDALAAGVTLAVHGVNILVACIIIGVVTGALSFLGVYAGRRFGVRLGRRLDVLGGIALIALGLKSLVEHYLSN
jgi:manganese efflux pump family protein